MNIKYSKLKELIQSEHNGKNWFNAYQCIDAFLVVHLAALGLDFVILPNNDKPELNTIASIELLIKNSK